jgi:hypothetical protein
VLGHRRKAHIETSRDVAGGKLSIPHQTKDGASARLGYDLQRIHPTSRLTFPA